MSFAQVKEYLSTPEAIAFPKGALNCAANVMCSAYLLMKDGGSSFEFLLCEIDCAFNLATCDPGVN